MIDADEFEGWAAGIEDLRKTDRLFASIGYYLFAARV